ncbi:unnamed protein product, partial [Prorocentrum cordatum]
IVGWEVYIKSRTNQVWTKFSNHKVQVACSLKGTVIWANQHMLEKVRTEVELTKQGVAGQLHTELPSDVGEASGAASADSVPAAVVIEDDSIGHDNGLEDGGIGNEQGREGDGIGHVKGLEGDGIGHEKGQEGDGIGHEKGQEGDGIGHEQGLEGSGIGHERGLEGGGGGHEQGLAGGGVGHEQVQKGGGIGYEKGVKDGGGVGVTGQTDTAIEATDEDDNGDVVVSDPEAEVYGTQPYDGDGPQKQAKRRRVSGTSGNDTQT